ncbi:MAG: sulfotransferase [Bacteroidetes bacterium]|nr:sulfotransferase [Bacteroidota bacterium]
MIFLVSAPRSGSTLLQYLLSNNTFVDTVSESWLLLHFCGLDQHGLLNAAFNYTQAQAATNSFLVSTGQQQSYSKNLGDFLLKTYMPVSNSSDTRYILDKTPRYYEILAFIRKVFPDAKIILLKRNPLSVLNSIIETWKIKNIPQLYSYHRDILHAPFLLQDGSLAHGDANTMVIKYEDLIRQPEKEVALLYEWLGIEYQAKVLNFAGNSKVFGPYGDKSPMLQKGRVVEIPERWPVKLEDKVWKKFFLGYLHFLGPDFLECYGYALPVQGKRTVAFDTYRYISENNVSSHVPIANPLAYLYYRSMSRLYAMR